MKVHVCPNCGGRLVADIMEGEVKVRCNACGQELGTFDRADKPVLINDGELSPLTADGTIDVSRLTHCPACESRNLAVTLIQPKQ